MNAKPNPDAEGHLPPPAWLVTLKYNPRRAEVETWFATRKEAEDYVAHRLGRTPPDGPEVCIVQDSSSLKVRFDGIPIRTVEDVGVRNRWLERYAAIIEPLSDSKTPVQLILWTQERVKDGPMHRLGGSPPQAIRNEWPQCFKCQKRMSYVAVLDLGDGDLLESLRDKALVVYRCKQCNIESLARWVRLSKDGNNLHSDSGSYFGRTVPTHDFEWNMDRISNAQFVIPSVLGSCPFFIVSAYGSKLGGYPTWLQQPAIPQCACSEPMRFLAQLAEGDWRKGEEGVFVYFFCCKNDRCDHVKSVVQVP